jgi:hypothetical protein
LASLVQKFENDPGLELVCAAADLTREGRFLYPRVPGPTFLGSLLGTNRLSHSGMIYRRASFLRVGVYSTRYRIASDYEHHFRAYFAGLKTACVADRLVEFDMGGISTDHEKSLAERERVHQDLRERFSPELWRQVQWGQKRETARLRVVKFLSRQPYARFLRPLWLGWNRLRKAS